MPRSAKSGGSNLNLRTSSFSKPVRTFGPLYNYNHTHGLQRGMDPGCQTGCKGGQKSWENMPVLCQDSLSTQHTRTRARKWVGVWSVGHGHPCPPNHLATRGPTRPKAQARPGPGQILEIWEPGNPEIWNPTKIKNINHYQKSNPFCPKCRQGLD